MQDRELYRQILGIESPWKVERVELHRAGGEVHVFLEHDEQVRWCCPECSAECGLHDHQPERCWRHLDTCQYRTILHARPPRSDCPEHGPRVGRLPWAEVSSRFTVLLEALAISWLKEASQQGVAELLALSWDVRIQWVKATARGFRNQQNFINAIYFHCGGLDMAPGH